jgi:ribonuclease BN (tRNA processing enzyme)
MFPDLATLLREHARVLVLSLDITPALAAISTALSAAPAASGLAIAAPSAAIAKSLASHFAKVAPSTPVTAVSGPLPDLSGCRVLLSYNLPPALPPVPDGLAHVLLSTRDSASLRAFAAANALPIADGLGGPRPIQVTCLGNGGWYATRTTHTVCWLIHELGILFDAGSGGFRLPPLCSTAVLDVFMSHGHLDHVLAIHLIARVGAHVRIHGEQNSLDAIRVLFSEPFVTEGSLFEYCPITDLTPIELENGALVTPFRVVHTAPCLGFRVDYRGRAFAYVTDSYSSAESAYVENLRGCGLVVHEGYLTRDSNSIAPKKGHSTSDSIIAICKAAGVEKVVLTHENPNGNGERVLAEVREQIPDAVLGKDEAVYEF